MNASIAPVVRPTRAHGWAALLNPDAMHGCVPETAGEVRARYEATVKQLGDAYLERVARAIPVQQRVIARCQLIPNHRALVPAGPVQRAAPRHRGQPRIHSTRDNRHADGAPTFDLFATGAGRDA